MDASDNERQSAKWGRTKKFHLHHTFCFPRRYAGAFPLVLFSGKVAALEKELRKTFETPDAIALFRLLFPVISNGGRIRIRIRAEISEQHEWFFFRRILD